MIVAHFTPAQHAAAPNIFAVVGPPAPLPAPTLDVTIRQACAAAQRAQAQALATQIRTLVGERPLVDTLDVTTDHAWLVLLGQFAQRLGLITALEQVPIPQRTRDHTPQTKLIQFFIGILAGLAYLQDFNDAPDPLVRDQAVSASWGQPAFAHYASISRTLAAADDSTLQAVMTALQRITQPFLDRELQALMVRGQPLVIDLDLAGRPVSPTSTAYPDATFGWMDDAVQKGYQAALTSLSGGPTGRLLLTSQRLSGHVSSAESLEAAIAALEAALGCHPRRRTELVAGRLRALTAQVQDSEWALQHAREQAQRQWQTLTHAYERRAQVQAHLRQAPAGRGATRAIAAREQADRRVARVARAYEKQVRRVQQAEAAWWKLQQTASALRARLEALQQAPTAEAPVPIVLRVDAGFSTAVNLAWLIEMGYTLYTKAHNGQTTSRLRCTLGAAVRWERVGANAEAVRLPAQVVNECPYPLEALLVRYHLPTEAQHTTLWYYGDEPPPRELRTWFGHYNGRQVIEAGIKEGKAVFTLRRPLVRSPIGMALQEEFARFAANFVRWAAQWAKGQVAQAHAALGTAFSEVKTLVRVVAHSRARLVQHSDGGMLIFDDRGPFAGAILRLWGAVIYQEVLPLFGHDYFTIHKPT